MDELRPLAIVDIDGVVADVRHRLRHVAGSRKDWDAFFGAVADDPAHAEGLAVVATLRDAHEVVFVTGRPERLREVTAAWLGDHGLGDHGLTGGRLVMRRDGDRRPAAQIKLAAIAALARERRIGIVVDDDPIVVDALRAAGYPTFAADWERRAAGDDEVLAEVQQRDGRS